MIKDWLQLPTNTKVFSRELYDEIKSLEKRIINLEEKTCGLSVSETPKMNSTIEWIGGVLTALQNKVGRAKWRWVDDPSVLPPEHPKVREWFIEKKKHSL